MAEGAQAASSDQLQQGTIPGVDTTPSTTAPAAAPPPEPTPAQPAAPVTATGAGTDGVSGGAGHDSVAAAGTPARDDILEYYAQRDPELAKRFSNSKAFVDHLYDLALRQHQQVQQYSGLAPLMQRYAAHAPQFETWLKQQEEAKQAADAEANKKWKPPEYDVAWEDAVYQDPATGRLMVKDGHDPSIIQKYVAAKQHARGFYAKQAFDPIGVWQEAGGTDIVKELAKEVFDQKLRDLQEKQIASAFLEQVRPWAFNQNGNLTPWGERLRYYMGKAGQAGMSDPNDIQDYALRMIDNDIYRVKLEQQQQPSSAAQPAAPANSQRDQAWLAAQAAAPVRQTPPSRGGASPAPGSSRVSGGDHRTQLHQLMAERAREAGLSVNGV